MVEPFDGPTVVVTHHAPSLLCVPASLLDDRMTAAYASRLDWLIEQHQPDLWVWGHIHEAVPPFRIGRTLMVSNPRGYVGQGVNPRFLPDPVVGVG
jgi:Icc-related predicted phosphoesterase